MNHSKRNRVNKNKKKDPKILYILTEGETEERYLKYLKSVYNCKFKLEIKTKSKLKGNISEHINRFLMEKGINKNELVLLYDLENSLDEYNKFVKDNKLIHNNTYLVQPCIEFHFLMHHDIRVSKDRVYEPKELLCSLKPVLPNYKKGSSFDWKKNGITIEHVTRARNTSKKQFDNYSDKSFSMIGCLIDKHLDKKVQ